MNSLNWEETFKKILISSFAGFALLSSAVNAQVKQIKY